MPIFGHEELRKICNKIFIACSASDKEAEIVSDAFVGANLAGCDSHGVIRIPRYVRYIKEGFIKPGAIIKVKHENGPMALIDGNWGFGQVIGRKAMEIAIEKSRKYSIGVVAVHNCNHLGRVADYPILAAKKGMIGLVMVNTHGGGKLVAPWGGRARRLSANPIACTIPRKNYPPISLDISCSVIAEGKIKNALHCGKMLPEGCIIDASGKPSCDPRDFYGPPQGALLPFGGIAGHKGFGLAIIVDILAGALTRAGCSREGVAHSGNGLLAIVINIENFRKRDDFDKDVEEFITYLKSSPTLPGFNEILIPGELELREEQRRLANGIEIDDKTWQTIQESANEVGVKL